MPNSSFHVRVPAQCRKSTQNRLYGRGAVVKKILRFFFSSTQVLLNLPGDSVLAGFDAPIDTESPILPNFPILTPEKL